MLIFEFCDGFNLKDFLQNKIGNGAFVNQVESTHYGYRINKNKTTPSLPRTRNDVEINNRHMPDTQINDNSADTILNVAENQTKIYTTTDLLRWSTQIANGLKFLASHNIVHCDLAARNIILCGNDIKICDFGLARVISKNEIYKMTNGSHFSPRWMAIEAHRNESIFNEKSDVWSFGLVMLEMFSEGQDPFPHISDDDINADTILTEIEAMNDDMSRKPSYTTQKIYNIMLTCWEIEPEERPSFGELERDICDLVNDEEDVEIEDYSENFECDDYERPLANYF
ncbi:vascular endothelial growth factor receptor 1-like [Contarinia nasturtii]|uniref:vascular endothelial growth factor receptor 1-like n=1 Tax=Contarinia nasturtii TaxID=265458 RepID=UPI0012D3BB86|nr:vascular endothelial growth factor receptor 1-like [Contarinia nasturtii]